MRNKLFPVIRHEYFTIVKQPTFWLIMLAIPALIAAVIAISFFSGRASEERIQEIAQDLENVTVIDESGLIEPTVAEASDVMLTSPSERDDVIDDVKSGEITAAIIFPADIRTTRSYDIYTSTNNLTTGSALSQYADTLLETSLFIPLGEPEIIALAQQGASSNVISYEDGRQTAGIAEYVVPGAILVAFYLVLVFSVNYMLTSVSEEKENRSMEMVLSYVPPRTLILGKLLGISLVTLTQMAFFAVVATIAYLVARQFSEQISLPLNIDLSVLVFDPIAIITGLIVLVLGFLLFAALMAGVGSMVPSAKDAGHLSFIFIIGAVLPFYTFSIIVDDPTSSVAQFMTYFPTTAPTTLLIRNTVGNLGGLEALLAITVLAIFAVLSIVLAGKLFRLGALEYANKLSLKQIFGK